MGTLRQAYISIYLPGSSKLLGSLEIPQLNQDRILCKSLNQSLSLRQGASALGVIRPQGGIYHFQFCGTVRVHCSQISRSAPNDTFI